jgi:hypothetical protein
MNTWKTASWIVQPLNPPTPLQQQRPKYVERIMCYIYRCTSIAFVDITDVDRTGVCIWKYIQRRNTYSSSLSFPSAIIYTVFEFKRDISPCLISCYFLSFLRYFGSVSVLPFLVSYFGFDFPSPVQSNSTLLSSFKQATVLTLVFVVQWSCCVKRPFCRKKVLLWWGSQSLFVHAAAAAQPSSFLR